MASLLQSTQNTRFLPTGDMRFIRSDAPLNLTEKDLQWLLERQVFTLVDLRSKEEADRYPCPLASDPRFYYHLLPVTGGGDTPKSRAHLHAVYQSMVDAQMEKILDTLLHAKTPAMYFCTAGKDRTGVVSALLLQRLGYGENVILQDYMLSKENLYDFLTGYVQGHPEVDLDIILPHPENITRLLHSL